MYNVYMYNIHIYNDYPKFDIVPFKKKSKFSSKRDAVIELYLSRFEEEILSLDEKIFYSSLTKGRRNALYLLYICLPSL